MGRDQNIKTIGYISLAYDELYLEEQLHKLDLIKENINISGRVLDIGCGTGISTRYFNALGIDPCKELIEIGSGDLKVANGEDLWFKDKEFDFVTCITSLHNFEDYNKGLFEMERVLKDEGRLIISLLKKSKRFKDISEVIEKIFIIFNRIDEGKDMIFFCEKRI
ncbi:MAG TPA: methyltransferase domain-containing protein [Candidatus Nanoarchaeia archaeon]|nr:methyltransferase domain-containing protein [Candidatus Nanoarchaeia archaeon]